jgi:hypothetical protein
MIKIIFMITKKAGTENLLFLDNIKHRCRYSFPYHKKVFSSSSLISGCTGNYCSILLFFSFLV